MDLEKLNGSYERAKQNLESKKKNIQKLEEELKKAMDDMKIAEGAKVVAQRKNDENDIKRADDEIKNIKARIEKIKKDAELEKEELQMFQDKINAVTKEIRENPEMKEHLEGVMAKRYIRQIRDINKDKKEQEKVKKEEENKLERYNEVQKLINEHSSMKNHMQGMLGANYAIQKLNDELSKLDPIKDKARIDQIKQEAQNENKRLTQNRDAILTYANKNKLKITKETLEEIMNNSVIDKKADRVNLQATLNATKGKSEKQIKDCDKKIAKCDKQISMNEKAIAKIGYTIEEPEEKKDEEKQDEEEQVEKAGKATKTENKLKWWQFGKRFKQWNESRKMKSLPDAKEADSKEEKSEFASSLKYKVVQDIAKQMQNENLKAVKKEEKGKDESQR